MERRPNLLVIVTDQHRYDCIGAAGLLPVATPNIDGLARRGVRFAQAYTTIPVCCPARQAMLHGQRPETYGALWNFSGCFPVASLNPHQYTWSKDLQEMGYRSAWIGKWHESQHHSPADFGFDTFIAESDYRRFREAEFPGVRRAHSWLGGTDPVPLSSASTHWLADRAADALVSLATAERPWHVRLSFPEPHPPYFPSPPFDRMYDPEEVPRWTSFDDTFRDKPYIQRQQLLNWSQEAYTWREWAPAVARYYGYVSQIDDAVGRLLGALERSGQRENTVVVFTSDHGDMCGSHRMMDKHYVMYDDVVRVPLIVAGPGLTAEGLVRCEPVYGGLDIGPTVAELCGLESPQWTGRSLLPLLHEAGPVEWRDGVVTTYNGQQFGLYTQRMLRTGRWKYVWNTTDRDELYDMEDDPHELDNRAGGSTHVRVLAELRKQLHHVLSTEGDPLVANPWLRHQLLDSAKL